MSNLLSALALGLTLATGIVLAGFRVADALYAARAAERHVTVKGLSEREVDANVVLWPLVFSVTGDDLEGAQARLRSDAAQITGFLQAQGFAPEEFAVSAPRVTDRVAQGFQPNPGVPFERYLIEATVTLRSQRVPEVMKAMPATGELVAKGVAIVRSYEYNAQYLFTGLEAVKPAMIAEATADARRAAQQFAADSGSRVGAIRNAQQGYFSVEDRDAFSPEKKRIRVVTTIEYFLSAE